jgi:hypothetical protein
MSALSQNLIFNVSNGNTTTESVQVVYPNTATTALIYNSEKIKGDGYFGNSDGLHTVFWSVSNFTGTLAVQGTLSTNPQESDWSNVKLASVSIPFTVDTTGLIRAANITATTFSTVTNTVETYNFVGNYVWLRGKISDFTRGAVNVISINR